MRQVASEAEFRAAVEGWIADDPDARDRAELQALLDLAYASTSADSGAAGSGAVGSGAVGSGAVGSGAVGSGAVGSGAAGSGARRARGRRARERGRSRNCTTGSRGGSSSGRPGCGGW